MSTGKPRVQQEVRGSSRCATWPSRDVAQFALDASRASATPACNLVRTAPAFARPSRRCRPARCASRRGCGVEHRLDLLGARASSCRRSPRAASCARRTTAALRRRTSPGRPCDARCAAAARRASRGSSPAASRRRGGNSVSVAVGPATVISPTCPGCTSSASDHCVDRVVVDADDAHLVRRHRAADAGAGAAFGGFARGLQFAAFDHRRPAGIRWRRRASTAARRRAAARACVRRRRPAPARRPTARASPSADARRARASTPTSAGEPNSCVTPKRSIACSNRRGSAFAGRVGIHVGNDRGQAERGIEQRERRERRQVDAAGFQRRTHRATCRPARRNADGDTPRPWARRSSRW